MFVGGAVGEIGRLACGKGPRKGPTCLRNGMILNEVGYSNNSPRAEKMICPTTRTPAVNVEDIAKTFEMGTYLDVFSKFSNAYGLRYHG